MQMLASLSSQALPDHAEILLPPQPAFIGRRSGSSANLVFMNSNISSASSLHTAVDEGEISPNSSRDTPSLHSRSHTLRSKADRVSNSLASHKDDRLFSPGPLTRMGSGFRSLGKRLFSRSASLESISDGRTSGTGERIETMQQEPSRGMSSPETFKHNWSPPTPSLSSVSASKSSSSRTSSPSDSPLLTPPLTCGLPSVPPTVAMGTIRSSYQSLTTATRRNGSFSPALTSPLQFGFADSKKSEGDSDFLQAVLSYAELERDDVLTKDVLSPLAVSRITQGEARRRTEEERQGKRAVMLQLPWARAVETDDDSADEYDDDVGEDDKEIANVNSIHAVTSPVGRGGYGLDSASKRALYTCTLMKIHPQLASALAPPGQASAVTSEIRLPRSINTARLLQSHPSSCSHSRSLRVGLARSHIIKALKTESMPLCHEQELQWFVQKYLPHYIAPENLAAQLAQRAAQSSLEALARPPLQQGNENGMLLWASRRAFLERSESFGEGKIILPLGDLTLNVGQVVDRVKAKAAPMPLQLSRRCKALAGLSETAMTLNVRNAVPLPPSNSSAGRLSPQSPAADRRRLPPWARKQSIPESTALSKHASLCQPTSIIPARAEGEEILESEEDVPLAILVDRRTRRAASERAASERASSSCEEFQERVRQQRDKEVAARRLRELKLVEDQKRLLGQARERRKKTDHADILSSPTYGAESVALFQSRRQDKAASESGHVDERRSGRSSRTVMPSRRLQDTHPRSCSQSHNLGAPERRVSPMDALTDKNREEKHTQRQAPQAQLSPIPSHRLSMVPHAMAPYAPIPLSSAAVFDPRHSMVVMAYPCASPYVHLLTSPHASPHNSLYNSSPVYQHHPDPLVYLAPEHVPTSARQTRRKEGASM